MFLGSVLISIVHALAVRTLVCAVVASEIVLDLAAAGAGLRRALLLAHDRTAANTFQLVLQQRLEFVVRVRQHHSRCGGAKLTLFFSGAGILEHRQALADNSTLPLLTHKSATTIHAKSIRPLIAPSPLVVSQHNVAHDWLQSIFLLRSRQVAVPRQMGRFRSGNTRRCAKLTRSSARHPPG